jgi:hypothetical protein
MATRGGAARYEVRAEFRAPLPYVFAWCTDYSVDDARLEKDSYSRKIVERAPRRVVYEDLYETPKGWTWSRHTVTLRPPRRWHSESVGSHRTWSLDYELRPLPDGRTELTLRGDRRATDVGGKNPPRAVLERDIRDAWRNFGRELEKDYRGRKPAR